MLSRAAQTAAYNFSRSLPTQSLQCAALHAHLTRQRAVQFRRFLSNSSNATGSSVFSVLQQRGFIADCTGRDELAALLESSQSVYCGFDPTAESLHVGNLLM